MSKEVDDLRQLAREAAREGQKFSCLPRQLLWWSWWPGHQWGKWTDSLRTENNGGIIGYVYTRHCERCGEFQSKYHALPQ